LELYPNDSEVLKLANYIKNGLKGITNPVFIEYTDEMHEMDMRVSELIEATDYERALKFANIRLICYSDDAFGYMSRAIVYSCLEQYDKCFEDFETAINIDKENYHIYLERARINLDLEKYEDALNDLNTAIQTNDKVPDLYSLKSLVLSDLQRDDEAINAINQAISVAPHEPYYYSLRALLYRYMEDYDNAIEDYKTAIRLNPVEYGECCYDDIETTKILQENKNAQANAFLLDETPASSIQNTESNTDVESVKETYKNKVINKLGRKVDW